jgi:multiple sugar transport system substrate-binding protein
MSKKMNLPPAATLSRRRFLRGVALGTATLAAGTLAACGASTPPANAPAGDAATAAPGAAAATAAAPAQTSGEPIKARAMMWANSPVLDENYKTRTEMFNKAHAGKYQIDMQLFPYDQYWSKLDLAYAAKQPIDVYAWDVQAYSHYKAGLLRNLEEDVKLVPELLNADQYPLELEKYWRFDGTNLYALPENLQMMALYYNKDIFDKAGIKYPDETWTYETMLDVAKQLTITQGDQTTQWGLDMGAMGAWWGVQTLGWAAGAAFFDKVIEPTKFTVSDPRNVEGMKFIQDLIFTHKVAPDAAQRQAAAQDIGIFQTGKVAMIMDGTWYMSSNKDVTFKWDMAPLPKWKDKRALPFWFGGWVVAKDSQAAEAAVKFATWSATEYQKTLTETKDWIPVRREERESAKMQETLPSGFKSVVATLGEAQIGDMYHAKGQQIINEVMNPTLDQMWNNKLTPEEAAKQIDDKANALLQKA